MISAALCQGILPLNELVMMLDQLLTLPSPHKNTSQRIIAHSTRIIHMRYWLHKAIGAPFRLTVTDLSSC